MSGVELYSWEFCPFAQRTWIALRLKRIDHALHDVDITKPRPDWFLELNPLGKVPTLVHDGRVVVESDVIDEYLEDAFPERPLLPRDAYRRAVSRTLIAHGTGTFIPALYRMLLNQDPERDRSLEEQALASWRWIDRLLRLHNPDGVYLFEEPTLADYAFGPFFQRWRLNEHYRGFAVPDSEEYARIRRWRDALLELPIVRETGFPHEDLVKLYADYARGYDNGKVPPGEERSSFDLAVPLDQRPLPPRGLRGAPNEAATGGDRASPTLPLEPTPEGGGHGGRPLERA
jgi:glutathione S-transferase